MIDGISTDTVKLLLIEDNDIDREIVRRAFRKADIPCEIVTARDGGEAIDLMLGDADNEPLPRPYMVMLDLDMPEIDGLEFLSEIRADPILRRTVIFVLTGAIRDDDRDRCYDHCVAGVLLKDRLNNDPVGLVSMLRDYWKLVDFPRE